MFVSAVLANRWTNLSDEFKLNSVFVAVLVVMLGLTLRIVPPTPASSSKAPRKIPVTVIKARPSVQKEELTVSAPVILQKPVEKRKEKPIVKKVVVQEETTKIEVAPAEEPTIVKAVATLDAPTMPDTPPPPPDDDKPPPSAYPDKPYGAALILAIKIDSEGAPIDVVIEVPSFNGMADLTFALAAKKIKYTDIQPPAPPGGAIWIEKRIEFPDPLKSNLP